MYRILKKRCLIGFLALIFSGAVVCFPVHAEYATISKTRIPRVDPIQKSSDLRPSEIDSGPRRRKTDSVLNEDFFYHKGEDLVKKTKNNLLIKLEADKEDCFVGESIVLSFRVYTRLLSRTDITDAPSFDGFSVSEMDVSNTPSKIETDGKTYNCYTLRKVQLFPTQPGTYDITPLKSVNHVSFLPEEKKHLPSSLLQMMQEIGAGGSASSPDIISKDIDISSNSLVIHVRPLPDTDRPADFRGAVGRFDIRSALTHIPQSINDVGSFTITITGSGNLALINYPHIVWPDGIEPFDVQTEDQINQENIPTSGSKIFVIPFSVLHGGVYVIPALTFSWFDPSLRRYEDAVTAPVRFHVSDVRENKLSTPTKTRAGQRLSSSKIEVISVIILIAGTVLVLLIGAEKRKKRESEISAAIKLDDEKYKPRDDRLESTGDILNPVYESLNAGNTEKFYHQLHEQLSAFLTQKLGLINEPVAREVVVQKMKNLAIPEETIVLCASVMETIEIALFAGKPDTTEMPPLAKDARKLISLLDQQIPKKNG